jgi:NADP-dependent 3-hydroxy acid dehydrogenase YdfG
MKVEGKVILVTGAGSGIGRALTLQLIAKGARVAGVDLSSGTLAATAAETNADEAHFKGYVADITDRERIEQLPAEIIAQFGAVDGIINNAGVIQPFVRLNDLDYKTIHRMMDINFYGTLHVVKAFLPHLLERPEAHIVNVASMGGLVPVPGQTIYGAAKAAVKLMSEGLAAELIDTRVKVSVAIPGAVATNIMGNSGVTMRTPAPDTKAPKGMKALEPAEAAKIIVAGIERDLYHIMVGTDAKLAGAFYRIHPALAARTIAKKMRSLLPS